MKRMNIEEIIRSKDIDTYRKLMGIKSKRKKKIMLGDKPERLMQHDAFVRVRRASRQI
ncbi:MAG: hypothetical protein JG759_1042 [Thermoanaerobacter sp.]|nr:hypothetical protein [Thermoanaerobacter sp.]